MNEILQREDSAYEKGYREPEEVICLISERMLVHRSRVELSLRPYLKQEHMALRPISQMAELDLNWTYPQGKQGDIAYIRTWAMADRDSEAALTIAGNARIWLNGQEVYNGNGMEKALAEVKSESEYTIINVSLHKGKNDLLMKCVKGENSWGLLLYIAYPRYPFRWTRDYLLSVRPTLPFEEMEGAEGFAHIGPLPEGVDTGYLEEAIERGEIGYDDRLRLPSGDEVQWEPRWKEEALGNHVDFREVYGDSQGCAYALSYVQGREGEKYVLRISASGSARVFTEGKMYEIPDGRETEIPITGNGKETEILVKLPRQGNDWWMEGAVYAEADVRVEDAMQTVSGKTPNGITNGKTPDGETTNTGTINIETTNIETTNRETADRGTVDGKAINRVPFVQIGNRGPARWIVTGPYVTEVGDPLVIPFAPEQNIQFQRPYPLGNYEHAFWRIPQKDAYVRPYRDGIFFGQWFYAVQVGLHGLMHAAKTTGNMEHLRYYLDSIQTMADYFDYKDWDKEQFGDPTLTPRAWGLPDLDACGTIGVSLIETYEMTGNPALLPVIHAVGNAVMTHIPRFPDRTYFRVRTMWADDLYMSCPFLARLYRLTGDKKYEDEVHLQVEGFRKRLWIEEEQIFSHIYFPEEERMSGIPWGRGNGWIAVTLTEILSLLPQDNPHWEEELQLYQRFMQGILACQDPSGMWHQVLNRLDSYQETSCTAMFLLSVTRGVNRGWLEAEEFLPCIRKAWTALLQYSVDAIGDVYGVCLGSGCAKDAEYYMQLPAKKNDDHGTGIVMMAAAEMMKLP